MWAPSRRTGPRPSSACLARLFSPPTFTSRWGCGLASSCQAERAQASMAPCPPRPRALKKATECEEGGFACIYSITQVLWPMLGEQELLFTLVGKLVAASLAHAQHLVHHPSTKLLLHLVLSQRRSHLSLHVLNRPAGRCAQRCGTTRNSGVGMEPIFRRSAS